MKSMKHLLRLVGALALTSTAATSVVACGGGEQKTDKQYFEEIIKTFTNGVNGTTLKVENTQGDALKLLQTVAEKIKNTAKVELVTATDAVTKLVKGNNTIKVKVTVGEVVVDTTDAIVKGVGVNDEDLVTEITTALITTGVNGSTLNDSQKQEDAKGLIQAAADKVTKGATFTFDNGKTSLTAGDNTVNITLTFGSIKDVKIAVKLTGVVTA